MSSLESTLEETSTTLLSEENIKATDLDFYALLRRQGSEGRLFFNQQRAVIFNVEAIGALRQQLLEALGPHLAENMLTRFGHAQGYKDADKLSKLNWESDVDWLLAGFSLRSLEGIAHVETNELNFNREKGHFYLQGNWRNSFEAEDYRQRYGLGDAPVCWMLTGYASGYASRFFGQKLLAVETHCLAKGDDCCRFEIRPADEWDAAAQARPQVESAINHIGSLEDKVEFLSTIVDNIPTMVFVKDAENLQFIHFNRAGEELIGISRQEMIGKSDYDFFPREEADFFTSKDREVLAAGKLVDIPEESIQTAKQGARILHTRKVPVMGRDGLPKYLLGISEDITDRKRAEKSLARRVAELETVAEVSIATSTILDVGQLLQTVTDLTKERFELYHAHIYLLNELGDTLNLAAGAGQVGRKMAAQGWSIPLAREQSLVARAARTRTGVIVNNVQLDPGFYQNPLLPNTRSELAVPIIVGDKLMGVLDVQSDRVDHFTEQEVQTHTILASQVAIALRNANLYTQVQEALAETEVLYEISAQVNAAVTLDEALQAAASPAVATDAQSAVLLTFELDEDKQELDWVTIASVWRQQQRPDMPVGARFHLSEFPFAQLWMKDPHNPILVGNAQQDPRLNPATRRIFKQNGVGAFVLIPLTLTGRWIGLIVIYWSMPHEFTHIDQRLYKSLATQTAVVVNNLILLAEAQRRAAQLQKLAHVEVALSQASNENEIVAAIASLVDVEQSAQIGLYYLESNAEGHPVSSYLVSYWQQGAIKADPLGLDRPTPPDQLLASRLWLNNHEAVILIDDVEQDARLEENDRRIAAEFKVSRAAIFPLHIGGRWQGVLIAGWPRDAGFTPEEHFVLQQLLEPVAAVVASRRAYVAQQQALAEAEALYTASQRINEAGDLQDIVAAVAETGPVPVIDRAVLEIFEYNPTGQQIEALTVVANWQRSPNQVSVTPVGKRYPLASFPYLKMLLSAQPLFFDDAQHDERIEPEMLELLQRLNIRAAAVLPLWVGTRQLGVLMLQSQQPHHFTEYEMQPYIALSKQVAVALENQRLLIETSEALAEVEATQRRYTLQAWETYLSKKQAMSYEIARDHDEINQNSLQLSAQNQSEEPALMSFQPQDAESRLVVPMMVRGEVIGLLGLEETETREWTPEEQILVEAIAQQLAQAAENLRLIDETQQRAAREKRLNEISDKIQAAQSLEEALQIAVKEVGLSLQTPETSIELGLD